MALGVWAAAPQQRRRAEANHRRFSPGIDEREARRRGRRSYREYGRTIADFLWAIDLDGTTVARRSRAEGMAHVRALQAEGRGAILALSHFGNWDMAANIALSLGVPLTTVMAPFGPPAITGLVIWARESNELEVFTPENAARGLIRAIRHGRFVCLLCDIPGAGPTVTVDYCGGPVVFTAAPSWLARVTGAPILPVDCRREGGGYVADVHPPVTAGRDEDDGAVMQRVATALEGAVRRHPGQWYPFGAVYADAG
ncbi:MAG TPA: lysophospholipid acyltransferase family protein [Candidatus Dormibacteraeota bacterium]